MNWNFEEDVKFGNKFCDISFVYGGAVGALGDNWPAILGLHVTEDESGSPYGQRFAIWTAVRCGSRSPDLIKMTLFLFLWCTRIHYTAQMLSTVLIVMVNNALFLTDYITIT